MKFKRLTALLTAMIFAAVPIAAFGAEYSGLSPENEPWYRLVERDRYAVDADAADEMISVSVNGAKQSFLTAPYIDGGEIMLPAKEFFEKLGFYIGWQDRTRNTDWCGAYFGEVNGAPVCIIPDYDVAYYDDIPLELGKKTVGADNEVFVPLYYFQFINGLEVKLTGKAEISFKFNKLVIEEEQEEEKEEINVDEVLKGYEGEKFLDFDKAIETGAYYTDGEVRAQVVTPDDGKFDKAIEIENLSRPTTYYANQFAFSSQKPINVGDVCVFSMWVRYTKAVDESGFASTEVCIEEEGTWKKIYYSPIETVTAEWQKIEYVFSSNIADDPQKVGIKVRVGFNYQTIEIAEVTVMNYGRQINPADLGLSTNKEVVKPESYRGQEDDALWREEALRRIEKYRKSPIKVKVQDENGNPVKDAKVDLNMTRSEFILGSEIGSHTWTKGDKRQLYMDGYKNMLNSFVYGTEFKPTTTEASMRSAIYMTNFARDNNLYVRGHAFIYDYAVSDFGNYTKDDIAEMDYEDFYNIYMQMCSWREALLGDYIAQYDLYNEPPEYRVSRNKYGLKFITDVLEAVNELIDDQDRFINTCGESGQPGALTFSKYGVNNRAVSELKEAGVEFDGFGMEAHSSGGNSPIDFYIQLEGQARNYDKCAVTEYDYITNVGDTYPEQQSTEAKYMRDFLIATYSQPKATGFTMWGYTDFYHWRRNAPLVDTNMHNKDEAMKYWNQLALGEWFPQLSETTDENGEVNVRTHRGNFDVTVTVGGKVGKTTLKSTEDGENTVVATVGKNDIEMQTSERVVTLAETTEPLNRDKADINQHNDKMAYMKLSESLTESIASGGGKDISYLADENNESPWLSSDSDNSLIIKLTEPRKKGYVAIDWDGEDSVYQLEASSDGINYAKFSGYEGVGHTYDKFTGEDIKYIRLSPAAGRMITPCRIAVYPVEFFARDVK